jgi:hypothetical protein
VALHDRTPDCTNLKAILKTLAVRFVKKHEKYKWDEMHFGDKETATENKKQRYVPDV